MPTVRRKTRLAKYRNREKCCPKGLKFLAVAILSAVMLYLFMQLTTRYWQSDGRVSLVVNGADGNVTVTTINPKAGEITNILIPGSTQLLVSRQLGSWRIKSIWMLGENEKLSGELLRESIVKNFHFPVEAWADSWAMGLGSGGFSPAIKAVFSVRKSNLGFGDRLKMAIFSLGVKNTKRTDISLVDTGYLKKTRLVDGEEGYILSGELPNSLLIIFSIPEVSKEGLKAHIIDASGRNLLGQDVGETLEVLGIKVASVEKRDPSDFDCIVKGEESDLVKKVARLFSCRPENGSPNGKFDIEVTLGETFAKRY
jgi:hypothetical protein